MAAARPPSEHPAPGSRPYSEPRPAAALWHEGGTAHWLSGSAWCALTDGRDVRSQQRVVDLREPASADVVDELLTR